jgi:hypothetical protein
LRHESPQLGWFTVDSACAEGLRLKLSATAGVLTIAGDEAFLGVADLVAFSSGDPMTIHQFGAPGTESYVSAAAIAIGDWVSTTTGGKVQTGTGGTVLLGKAKTATTGDGQMLEVIPLSALFNVGRSQITQQDLVPYTIPLTSLRVHDAMQTNLPGTSSADDMGLITGTPGTDVPTLQGVDFGGTSTDEKGAFEFVLPAEYVAAETITVRVRAAMLTSVSDGTALVDVECWKAGDDGAAGSDICATAAQSINSLTPANKDFTITPTGLAAGDRLLIRVAFSGSDVGNLAVMIPEISKLQVLLDIKG